MTRPTRAIATLLALLGGVAATTGAASAQNYLSPPAYHVPTTSYGSTIYEPVAIAPARPATIAGALTQPQGGRIVYRAVPAPVPSVTRTYIAPATVQPVPIDDGVTYAPYYGTPQPTTYRRPVPVPVYRAPPPAPVRTWVRPPQPVYAPAPVHSGADFAAPAIIGGLFGAAILGAILLNDDDDRDDHRHRGRDHRGERHDGARRQDRRDDERRVSRREDRAEQPRGERRITREERRERRRAERRENRRPTRGN